MEVDYKGKGKYYPRVIKMAKFDGTFDIDYSGEEVETNVPKSRVRPRSTTMFPTTTMTTASDTLTLTSRH